MVKSLRDNCVSVLSALIDDARRAYPQEAAEFHRDMTRVSLLARTRGLGFFTLDLPNLDSILTDGLEKGVLTLGGILSMRVSKSVHYPRFLRGLWKRVFDENGRVLKTADESAILFLRQIFCLGKKLTLECTPKRRVAAIKEYINVDRGLRSPTLSWTSDTLCDDGNLRDVHFCDSLDDPLPLFPDIESGTEESGEPSIAYLCEGLQHVADFLAAELGHFDPVAFSEELWDRGAGPGTRHGPGAVASGPRTTNKYSFPYWSKKLERVFPFTHFIDVTSMKREARNHELPSRLILVPKTAKTPRLIAAEPVEHMFCQQLILRFLEDRFESMFGKETITLRDQSPSRTMARQASLNKRHSTVDLSSASDRLSLHVVERIFRNNYSVLSALHAARTRSISVNIDGIRETFVLRKFASQGTATTFPVQSFVFLCIAVAAHIGKRHPTRADIRSAVRRIRVFGDDMIVPTPGYVRLRKLLHHLQLKVNENKSFALGSFRESCGGDYFNGIDVTPLKPASLAYATPPSIQSLIDTSNLFFRRGFWRTAEAVLEMVPASFRKKLAIVGMDCGAFGIASFIGKNVDHLVKRWNHNLHRDEVRTLLTRSIARRKYSGGEAAVLQYFVERPKPDSGWSHGTAVAPRVVIREGWEATCSFE